MLCLAALMGREASGYDVKKDLERGSAFGLIDASFGSIYPALTRLADEGFIEARAEGGRDKKIYAITPSGRQLLLRTLSGPLPDEKFRSPFLFAMLFVDEMPRERVRSLIDRQLEIWQGKIDAVAEIERKEGGPPRAAGQRFVREFGRATLTAGIDFLRRHRQGLEDAAQTAPADAVA